MHCLASSGMSSWTPAIGWGAAAVLVLTIGWQSFKLWQDRDSSGVSVWLFVGQVVANTLFASYAFLTGDYIFLVANLLLLVASLFGLALKMRHIARGKGG